MRIGLDARNLRPEQTGIGRVVFNMIKELADLDRENEYIIIKRSEYVSKIVNKENFREISIPHDPSSLRSCVFGFSEINDLKLDVYHSFFHLLPGNIKAKRVIVTLHDLMWIDNPELVFEEYYRQKFIEFYGKNFIRRALEYSDSIVAISEYTKDRALCRYRLPEEQIHVIPHGVDRAYFEKYASVVPVEGYINRKYIFSIGHTRPYKNIPSVIKAFKQISSEFPDVDLIITGRGDYKIKLHRLVSELNLDARVVFAGHLPDEKMIPIFKNAQFLVFPSLIEGFGLPIIEAMAIGCPVLGSDIPVFKEIGGDAYEKVDPHSIDDIACGMRKLLRSREYRDCLRHMGYQRSKLFSWEESAGKLQSVLCKC